MTETNRLLTGAVLVFALSAVQGLALDNSKELSSYGRQTWQTESGLPQNTIHAILQTRDGYIWLGTEGGVVRFDGLKFVVYDTQNTPKLRSNNIRTLLEDRQGALWIGTADGLTRLKDSEFSSLTADQGLPMLPNSNVAPVVVDDLKGRLPSKRITATYEDKEGSIWVSTDRGVAGITGNRIERFAPNDFLYAGLVFAFYE